MRATIFIEPEKKCPLAKTGGGCLSWGGEACDLEAGAKCSRDEDMCCPLTDCDDPYGYCVKPVEVQPGMKMFDSKETCTCNAWCLSLH